MKPVDQPYEAHQICDTCQEDGEFFMEEMFDLTGRSVWKSKKRMAGPVKPNDNNANKKMFR